jgi:hypothetical protein
VNKFVVIVALAGLLYQNRNLFLGMESFSSQRKLFLSIVYQIMVVRQGQRHRVISSVSERPPLLGQVGGSIPSLPTFILSSNVVAVQRGESSRL